MNPHRLELELQSLLDGELNQTDVARVRAALSENLHAQGIFAELQNTRQLLTATRPIVKVPASREFYWSQVQKEILRAQSLRNSGSVADRGLSLFEQWRRLLIPAGAFAAVVLSLLLSLQYLGPMSVAGPELESFASTAAFSYRDYASRTTLVWLSYPAEDTSE
jgi:anti-sigma factor RsiW